MPAPRCSPGSGAGPQRLDRHRMHRGRSGGGGVKWRSRPPEGGRLGKSKDLQVLPGRLGDARKLTTVCHVAEANTGDTELLEGTAWATVDCVAVANADRGSIAWKLLQAYACSFASFVGCVWINQGLLQFETLCSVTLDNDLALFVLCDLGLLGHVLALLSEFNVLADDWVVLLHDHAVRIVTTVLTGYVSETGASGGLQLDDRTYVLILLCHF